jgi:hypothetical protein
MAAAAFSLVSVTEDFPMRYVLFLGLALIAGSAEAGPFGLFRRSSGHATTAAPRQSCNTCDAQPAEMQAEQGGVYGGDDQARCQQEANLMAARRIRGHLGGTIGRFEGVGYGGSPNCATCTPERFGYHGLRLSGDASARGSDGMWYRVRSWR